MAGSNGIGGGGGGLLGAIGAIFDPQGLMGGEGMKSNGGPDLKGLLDPAGAFGAIGGLIGAIAGEVDKANANSNGDDSIKAQGQKFLEYTRLSKDIAQQFQSDGTQGTDPKRDPDSSPQVETGSNSNTSGTGYAGQIQQDASTAAEDKELIAELQDLLNNFSWMSRSGNDFDVDGWLDMNNIDATLIKGNNGQLQPGLERAVAAAQRLKSDPELWAQLVAASGSNQNGVNEEGIRKLSATLMSKGTAAPPPANTPPPSGEIKTGPDLSGVKAQGLEDKTGTGKTSGDKTTEQKSQVDYADILAAANKAASASFANTSKSVENRLMDGGMAYLGSLDAQLDQLMTKGELSQSDQLKVQRLMQKRTEMYQMVSNVMNMFHEMSMAAIHNIR